MYISTQTFSYSLITLYEVIKLLYKSHKKLKYSLKMYGSYIIYRTICFIVHPCIILIFFFLCYFSMFCGFFLMCNRVFFSEEFKRIHLMITWVLIGQFNIYFYCFPLFKKLLKQTNLQGQNLHKK